ncbi:MaoC/PaaZ C-terminal domain-containing protein [Streptosporangium sp. NPDC051022]|uniref:MaoC/PaaZ C-terminal domain-containing protein n=1 Tax=Streptosporangium sp. NPDC051022 TaxID=3155752 RepID=UPI00344822F3
MIKVGETRTFDSVTVGETLPETEHRPTSRELVRYTAAAGDYYEPHYDLEAAREANLPGVVVHGLLKAAWLTRCVTEWAGPDVAVLSVDVRYRGMDLVNERYVVGGTVVGLHDDDEGRRVEVEVWGRSDIRATTTLGTVTVELPDARP